MNKLARSDTEVLRGSSSRKARSRSALRLPPERPVSVRFEPEIIQRLDRVAQHLSQLNTNIRIGRSSVVKLAIERALMELEAELSIVAR